jgi:hypothetical protein
LNLKKSLQTLKNDLQKKEDIRKRIHDKYPQLIHLSEQQLYIYFEVKTILALKEIEIQQNIPQIDALPICTCTDSQNKIKDLYVSERSADKQAQLSGKNLKIYPCPATTGWHLSKR